MATNRPFEFFIQWHLTEKCNLRCGHCYQDKRCGDELSLREIRDGISEVSGMIKDWSASYGVSFSPSMNITGGEPFLRKDLFEILAEIKREGFKTYLLTNGTLVSRDRAEKLAALGVDGVQVSIEGPEDVHDALRGKGSFAAAAGGIENFVAAGLAVTLNATLSGLNVSSLRKIIDFASQRGARRVGFSRLVPAGRGLSLLSRMLTREQVKELYESVHSWESTGLEIATGDPVASQMKAALHGDAGNIAVSGCSAGVAGLTIQPDGNITPCRRLPVSVGNVRADSLREIWATSPVLQALRDRSRYQGRCGACPRWAHCRGCRAIAYAWSQSRGDNDFLADDPQCFLEM
jgi:radical SAM protein with 4Fe4S-binding SPASM domain